MGNEIRYKCLVETRRLLLLMGVVFAFVLFIQYFELPYSSGISSLFSAGKSPSRDSFSTPNASRNSTLPSRLNSTKANLDGGVSAGNDSRITNFNDNFDPENGKTVDNASNDDIDPEDENPSDDFLEVIPNSTTQEAARITSLAPGESNLELPVVKNYNTSTDRRNPEFVTNLPSHFNPPENNGQSSSILMNDSSPSTSSTGNEAENISPRTKIPSASNSSVTVKGKPKGGATAVVPISKMNDLLLQSRVSYRGMKPRWSSPADRELLNVKTLIDNAPIIEKDPHVDVKLYRNFSAFKRSYELMEQTLKVYIYSEGESPIFHRPPLKGIYASEGWFMKLMKASKKFTTKNPTKAHLFYLPFSSRMLEIALYVPESHSRSNLVEYLSNYLEMIKTKYPFWNRTDGSDHFLVACHDWAPHETRNIMANCIRSLCNADIGGGFQFGKDASLPETIVRTPQNPLRQLGGRPASQRPILAFFAGSMHGYLRPILLKYWGDQKDPDMKIFGKLRKVKGETSYAQYMKSSKYCICARGYEVNSPRVVEAIFYECVPVIISDNFVPPFFESLNWESFAVFVLEKDIPNLKNILKSISKRRYLKMQQRVKQVQQHFLWHSNKPVKYDVFHMILHSVWHNRVFQTSSY